MQKVLVVVDMQNDFIDGALGTKKERSFLYRTVSVTPKDGRSEAN